MSKPILLAVALSFLCAMSSKAVVVTINSTGTTGSFNTGSVNAAGTKNDGNMVTVNSSSNVGWAVFDLSSIPGGSTINSVSVTFTTYSSTSSSGTNYIGGFTGSPATMSGTALYTAASITSGTAFNASSWTANASNTKAFNAAGNTFIANNLGSSVGIAFTRGSTNTYNIYGYPGTAAQQPQLTIDYTVNPPCSGTPNAGTAASSPAGAICPNTPLTLSLTGYSSPFSGIGIQWQSSPAGQGSWSNIAGATTPTYVVSSVPAATDYRAVVTCTPSGLSATSNTVAVTVNPFYNCYCSSSATSTADEEILNVTFNTLNNTTTCASSNKMYSDFRPLGSQTTVTAGASYPLSLILGTCGGNYGRTAKVFIDYNRDGVYQNPAEMVHTVTYASSVANPQTTSTNVTVPITAQAGVTGMRVVYVETTTAGNVNPCGTYTWGETEDYLVTIVLPPPCSGTPVAGAASGPASICPGIPFNLNLSGYTVGSNIVFQWQSSPAGQNNWTNISGATATSYTVSSGITASTDYRLQITCTTSGQTAVSNTVSVALNAYQNCYCTPTYTTGCSSQDDINTFILNGANGTSFNQTGTGCSPGAYANYTTLTPVQLVQGQSYAGQINSTYTSSEYVRMWIDFNDNALFETTEQVSTAGPFGTTLVPFTLAVPATANLGLHRLRARVVYAQSPASSIDPCSSYTYGETHDYNVLIIGTPAAPAASNNSPRCTGDSITLTAVSNAPSPVFNWTGPAGFTATGSTVTFATTTASAGAYNVTVTSYGYTSAAASTTVTLYPTPVIATGTVTNPTTCGGSNGSIQITGLPVSTICTLSYARNNVPVGPLVINTSATGTYTIGNLNVATYSAIKVVTDLGCTSNTLASVTLVPPTAPSAPAATYNNPLCLNGTLQLSVTNPAANGTYSWLGPNGYTASGTTATRANMTQANAGNYTVTVTINGCTSPTGTVAVVVNNPPAAPVPGSVTYCQNEVAAPLTASGQNLMWYTSATGGVGTPNAPVPSTAVPGTTTYYVSQTVNTCEGPRAALTVTVKPQPQPPVAVQQVELCQFATAGALTATGTSIRWYTVPSGGTGSSTAPVPSTAAPGTTVYYATQTVNGCESNRLPINVLVKPKPAPPAVSSPLSLCQYGPSQALTATGQNLMWYTSATGGFGSATAPVPSTSYADTLSWYVTQTVNGCESDRAKLDVVVHYKPNALILASKNFVCLNDTISFSYYGNATAAAAYNWSVPATAGTVVSGGGQGPLVVQFSQTGTQQVSLQVNNNGCLSPVVTKTIEVRSLPGVNINMPSRACEGETVNISFNSATAGISNYQWDFAGGQEIYGSYPAGPYGIRWNGMGQKVVTVVVTSRDCPSTPIRDTIEIVPAPVAKILSATSNDICSGDSVLLKAADQGPDYTYTWTPAAYFGTQPGSPEAIARISLTGMVKLTVSDPSGCSASDSMYIKTHSCCEVYFPNAFSPNNDGRNDVFRIISKGHHAVSSFRVLNRWGKVLFETDDERRGWDGTFGGTPQDMGTYFYYIKYRCADGKDYEQKGELLLLR